MDTTFPTNRTIINNRHVIHEGFRNNEDLRKKLHEVLLYLQGLEEDNTSHLADIGCAIGLSISALGVIKDEIFKRHDIEKENGLPALQGEANNKMEYETPRRNRLDLNTPAEKAIWEAMQEVEKTGAHPLLTDAINMLKQAKEKVSDFVDTLIDQEAWFL